MWLSARSSSPNAFLHCVCFRGTATLADSLSAVTNFIAFAQAPSGVTLMASYLKALRGDGGGQPVHIDTSSIRKEGWVFKESAVVRQYRKRWMVLTPDKLYSFKTERSYHQAPTEEIDLKSCGTVKSADDLTNRQFTFTVQIPDRNFFLMASSDAERNEWVAAIGRATTENRRVRSYSEERDYQEQQALQAAMRANGTDSEEQEIEPPKRGGSRFT